MTNEEVPTKVHPFLSAQLNNCDYNTLSREGLVSLISLFSPKMTFFINAWTWGYEDIFHAIAHSFQSQVHLFLLYSPVH